MGNLDLVGEISLENTNLDSLKINEVLYCHNITNNMNNTLQFNSSNIDLNANNVRLGTTFYLNNNIVKIDTDISTAKNVFIDDTVYCSNLEVSGELTILGKVNTIDTNIKVTEIY